MWWYKIPVGRAREFGGGRFSTVTEAPLLHHSRIVEYIPEKLARGLTSGCRPGLRVCLTLVAMYADFPVYADNVIKFLREAMEKAGCPVGDRFFSAMNCSMNAGGGFMPEGEGVSHINLHTL